MTLAALYLCLFLLHFLWRKLCLQIRFSSQTASSSCCPASKASSPAPAPAQSLFYDCFHMSVCALYQRCKSNQLLTCVLFSFSFFFFVCHNKLDDPVFALYSLQATAMACLLSMSPKPGSDCFVDSMNNFDFIT